VRDELASELIRRLTAWYRLGRAFNRSRSVFPILVLLACAPVAQAIPLDQYHDRIQQAIRALDTLTQSDETETETARSARVTTTLTGVRGIVPASETVEWDGTNFTADNSWLHRELERFEKESEPERRLLLTHITQRLQALEERLAEIKNAKPKGLNKAEAKGKLGEILQRSEYSHNVQQDTAVTRLWRAIKRWLQSFLPQPKPMQPGSATLVTKLAQVFVILLALAVVAYALKLFAPRLLRRERTKKKGKKEPRIVLGEKLDPDQSAIDLLTEAEGLARQGELRAAIRKAYIALLVELGERKIISLAQHKTNRDYLGAVRHREPLYAHVKQLTDSFERHWYGFAGASEADWLAFRAGYKTVTSGKY